MEKASIWRALTTGMALTFGAQCSNAQDSAQPISEILMVCEHGNVKSLMAASYFNQLASERHLGFHAFARGTSPNSNTVPAPIIDGLRTDGFDVADFHPLKISAADT